MEVLELQYGAPLKLGLLSDLLTGVIDQDGSRKTRVTPLCIRKQKELDICGLHFQKLYMIENKSVS
jgi:hypothetical protein